VESLLLVQPLPPTMTGQRGKHLVTVGHIIFHRLPGVRMRAAKVTGKKKGDGASACTRTLAASLRIGLRRSLQSPWQAN
jgi:hypothetical protein